ncbi:Nuclear transport factor 2 [Macleaya cordata]|uniref:Nuclear transport factor 2 n=1 Tax=Macleaya cordata TaxID=56857 RepID=A0A200PPP5_MACCD|nr:Nuclear transport factor 2 [Macleaya cordata]
MKVEVDKWVERYFKLFNANPTSVGTLYNEDAVFSRDNKKIFSKDKILAEYNSVSYNRPKVNMNTFKSDFLLSEPQLGEEAGLLVLVWGGITFPGQNERKFNPWKENKLTPTGS